MVNRPPRIKDILSGMILLAARGRDPMPLAKVHSIIHEMKPHESILSGLRFSLTGAVCYSRDIDQAINHLTEGGFLKIVDGSVFVGEHAHEFGRLSVGVSHEFPDPGRPLRFAPFSRTGTKRCQGSPEPQIIRHRDERGW